MGRAVCHDCNARLKAESLDKYMCFKCHSIIDGEPLRWRGDTYHPYHFNCSNCDVELTHMAREVKSRPGYTANQMVSYYGICKVFIRFIIIWQTGKSSVLTN